MKIRKEFKLSESVVKKILAKAKKEKVTQSEALEMLLKGK